MVRGQQTFLGSNSKEVAHAIGQVAPFLTRELRLAMLKSMGNFSRKMKRGQFSGFANSPNRSFSNKLRNRTGYLRNSLSDGEVRGTTLETLEGRIGIGDHKSAYAAVQEFGTRGAGGKLPDIRPKRAKFLTVPLLGTLTRSGVVKARYRIKEKGKGNFQAGGKPTFIWKSRKNILFVAITTGGKLKLLYRLQRSSAIKPRLGFFRTWKELEAKRGRILNKAARKALEDRSAATGKVTLKGK